MKPADHPHDVSQQLHELLLEDHDVSGFLHDLARASAAHISGDRNVLCGIILHRPKRDSVVASSSSEAHRLDELQAGFDEGPCLEAKRTNTVILVPDARFEARWPRYMKTIRDQGLHSVMAVPLELVGGARAAMNFYTAEPGAFGAQDLEDAQLYVGLASKVVRIGLRVAGHSETADHRRAAMESRTPIDLAVGIVMAQNRCSQAEAFGVLQRASSNRNIKLRVLAEELITSVGQQLPTTAFDS